MPIFMVTFSSAQAGDLEATKLPAAGAVRMWPGCWLIAAADLADARERLNCVRTAAGHMMALLDPAQIDAVMAFAVSAEARIFFHEQLASPVFAARPDIRAQGRILPIGTPRADVMRAMERAVSDPPARRAITPLCRIMLEEGSDKSLGWHSYTPLYADLLATIEGGVKTVFEFGLGSNNPDVPSNMGPSGVPGASLRGWRRFLPGAAIGGADVDRRILFQEEAISTFFVDQMAPETITAMWAEAGTGPRDIIIDDGLHIPEAAANTLAGSLEQIGSHGLYIVEDVVVPQAEHYLELGRKHGLSGGLMILASIFNSNDNALLVLHR